MPAMARALPSALAITLLAVAAGCDLGPKPIPSVRESGELVVLTINGPATYFEDASGHPSGFEHDLASLFAKELGVPARFVLADDPTQAEAAMKRGAAHIAAALLVRHFDLPGGVAWGPSYLSAQHQVACRALDPRPRILADIVGRRIGVVEESFADALLSEPPKLTVPIRRLPPGTPVAELLAQVTDGRLDCAVLESTRLTLLRKHFPAIDVVLNVGAPVEYAWMIAAGDRARLSAAAAQFFARIAKDGTLKRLFDRYYAHATRISSIDSGTLLARSGTLLPELRPHFQSAELESGVDWRLLAAIGYQESHWDARATSPTGVRGLMMLTEDTAERMKVADRLDARESILGGARYFMMLRDQLPQRIAEPDRTFFALAAYNLGIGHLEDARVLAQRSGLNPDQWQDVKQVMAKLADPAVFHSLKHGFARGYEALQFVDNVRNYYDILDRLQPREAPLAPRVASGDQGMAGAASR
jgi:membrane-bound lytic murein transglycosylase F